VRPPFVLFVPAYGQGGSGEFVRAVALAEAARARWPKLRIEFVLPGGEGTRQDVPFTRHCHAGSSEDKPAFDDESLRTLRPDVAIFDSGLRSATLRLTRELGIHSVYVSDRAGTCRKAFRLDWLRTLDQHWHQREHLMRPAFTTWQRLRACASSTRRTVFDTYLSVTPPHEGGLPAFVAGRLQGDFALFAPGGGGYSIGGRPVSEIFLEAAEQLHARSGVECLTLLGPLYGGAAMARDTMALPSVDAGRFIELMRRAKILITNGGQTVAQALACRVAVVAAPLGGSDQEERIARCAAAGLLLTAKPQSEALAERAQWLLQNADARAGLLARVGARPIVNGIPLALDALEPLLGSGRH
jgi:hypothetical protein